MAARQIIELKKGVKVELLFTPSLFGVARRRGLALTIKDQEDELEVMEAYVKLSYIAALNAWEAKQYDAPELGDFSYNYEDFQEWAANDPKALARLVPIIFTALTGKDLKEAANLGDQGKEPVKKKPSTFWRRLITRLSEAF